MRSFQRRILGAALLPLLILASVIGSGAWFCADGSPCEPAFAATCCCGDAQKALAAQDACPAEAAPQSHAGMRPSCGCYYRAERMASAALLTAPRSFETTVALPVSATPAAATPVLITAAPLRTDAVPPPRFRLSPRETRAPPSA